jgi:hypothetical protein
MYKNWRPSTLARCLMQVEASFLLWMTSFNHSLPRPLPQALAITWWGARLGMLRSKISWRQSTSLFSIWITRRRTKT